MIPIAYDLDVTLEPHVNKPTLPKMKTLGTVLDFSEELEMNTEEMLTEFKNKSNAEMECCEERREGYQCSERQRITTPKVKDLKGFHIEMLFGYSGDDGTQYLGWYHGTVQDIVNEKTNRVIIKWDA